MSSKNKRLRLDHLLLERGLLGSLSEAGSYIMQGFVLVDDRKILKPGEQVSSQVSIRLLNSPSKYVSRGGDKLASAIRQFQLSFKDAFVLDVGISTGGFTDCVIQHGASHVVGLDVGYGQVAQKLLSSTQVTVIERCNARLLTTESFAGLLKEHQAPSSFLQTLSYVVMDVSFISVSLVLPVIKTLVPKNTVFVILIKPQFEAFSEELPPGAVLLDDTVINTILSRTLEKLESSGFKLLKKCASELKGAKGNQEFFFLLKIE